MGKPWETTAKAEGAPSETAVTVSNLYTPNIYTPSLSFATLCTTSAAEETEVSVFYGPVFSYECKIRPDNF